MRKSILLIALLWVSSCLWAWTSPVTVPSVGDARLHIVGQNTENYLMNLEASNSSCYDEADFAAKTNNMANVFLALEADIVALCEVEENDEILGILVNEMNSLYGQNVYTFITDGFYVHASAGSYQQIKAGFIYRTDKVETVGYSYSPYNSFPYKARMRIQTFKEKSTGEIFTLSMNHFKAKDSSEDEGESTRIENVTYLLGEIEDITLDPDILVMGDLNAYMGEAPIEALENAGFEEQLVRFDPYAYTYIYRKQKGILDHALANETMAEQVTGAYAYHINTYNYNSSYHYSDHDAVLVGLKLGKEHPHGEGLEDAGDGQTAVKTIVNGQLVIERNGVLYSVQGFVINN